MSHIFLLDTGALKTTGGKAEVPSLDKEGWLRPLRKCREASLAGADGVVGSSHRLSEVERTTPSAPAKERDHLLDGASTPPLPRRGGRLFHRLFHPLCPADDLWVMIRSGVGAGKRNPQSEISITHVLSSLSGRPGRGGSRRRRRLFQRSRNGFPGTAQPGWRFDLGLDWRMDRRPIFLLPRARTREAMVGPDREGRAAEQARPV